MEYVISIDIGGTNTRVALVDNNYQVIKKVSFSSDSNSPTRTLEAIANTIRGFKKNIVGIGLSCPGPLDLVHGTVLTPPNLPGWHGFKIVEELEELTKLKVTLENDANLAGLAENVCGSAKSCSRVQYMTISTGLGGGFIIDEEIYQGAHGFAQEIANVIVYPKGPKIGDLMEGSLESIASGTAITERARRHNLEVEHAGEVKNLADKGNFQARFIIDDAIEYLSNAIAMSYAFLDPDIVVLGGSVALKLDGFVEEVEKRVKEKTFSVLVPHVKIVKASLGDDSGIIGGGILAWNSIKK